MKLTAQHIYEIIKRQADNDYSKGAVDWIILASGDLHVAMQVEIKNEMAELKGTERPGCTHRCAYCEDFYATEENPLEEFDGHPICESCHVGQLKEKLKETIGRSLYHFNRFKTWSSVSDDRFAEYSDSINLESKEAIEFLTQLDIAEITQQ